METIKFVVAPDFAPQRTPCLQIFSTLLSKHTGFHVQQTLAMAPDEVTQAVEAGGVDLVYCNPFLAEQLYKEHGYTPILRPTGPDAIDNVIVFSAADGPIQSLQDIKPGMKATCPGNLGVKTVSLFMNKKLNLGLNFETSENTQQVIQKVRRGEADLGLYLHQTYADLSDLAKGQLKVLDKTDLDAMGFGCTRRILMGKGEAATIEAIKKAVIGFKTAPDAGEMLEKLRVKDGFEAMTDEMVQEVIDKIAEMKAAIAA